MKLSEVIAALELTPLIDVNDCDVSGAYCSDLLSDVVGNAQANGVLITVQVHRNVVAVANLVGLAAVIITHGRRPDDSVLEAARENGINLLGSPASSFTVAGQLYELGLR